MVLNDSSSGTQKDRTQRHSTIGLHRNGVLQAGSDDQTVAVDLFFAQSAAELNFLKLS
jgi:hypothetical protein